MFKDFDNYLLSSFSEDYWSDEGISFAEVKLCEFSNEDWLTINNDWRDRDSFWLIRCADVLGDFNDSKSMNLLLSFLSVDNVEVQIAALDSINSLLSMGMITKDFDMDLISKIKKIKSSSIVVNAMLNSLDNKLKK
ncbi:hypothetical protein ACQKC9_01785 [Psychrobacter sp. NPDC078409]|uniref:hypothetical protein n=1 Tax=Psychrobacter sp. NPDC078409 TaxID=3390660 RepID=UPI003CFD6D07